jgi:hypothetical protein
LFNLRTSSNKRLENTANAAAKQVNTSLTPSYINFAQSKDIGDIGVAKYLDLRFKGKNARGRLPIVWIELENHRWWHGAETEVKEKNHPCLYSA